MREGEGGCEQARAAITFAACSSCWPTLPEKAPPLTLSVTFSTAAPRRSDEASESLSARENVSPKTESSRTCHKGVWKGGEVKGW